jgi:hypothetical protein
MTFLTSLAFLLLATNKADACPDLSSSLDAAVGHLLAADTGSRDLDAAESAFGCEPVLPAQVARYLVTRGGASEFAVPGSGVRWFASARAVDATVWEDRFGEDLRGIWSASVIDGHGSLLLDANAAHGWVDGKAVTVWPFEASAGWHVVQVVDATRGDVLFGRVVNLPAGESSLVQTGLAAVEERKMETTGPLAPVAQGLIPKHRVASPVGLVLAGVLAAAGAGLAAGSQVEAAHVSSAATPDALDTAWQGQRGLAWGAYSAFGAAGVVAGLSFVLR